MDSSGGLRRWTGGADWRGRLAGGSVAVSWGGADVARVARRAGRSPKAAAKTGRNDPVVAAASVPVGHSERSALLN